MQLSTSARTTFRLVPILLAGLFASTIAVGCASPGGSKGVEWPTADVVPSDQPDELETEAPGSVLRRGSDGFLYAVGGLPDGAEPGTPFLARYSGDWPLKETPRPPLAAGRVVRTLSNETAVVHLSYRMPETDLEDLELTWEDEIFSTQVGKGLARVSAVRKGEPTSVKLDVGRKPGLQSGDVYAILTPPSAIDAPIDVQLSHRFKGICVVDQSDDDSTRCRMRSLPNGDPVADKGDTALFLEHITGKPPQTALVQVAAPTGSKGGAAAEAHERLLESFREFVSANPDANIEVEPIERRLEATRSDFHRVENELEYTGQPQMAVGLEVVERDGDSHVVVNYTGVGPANGPGMVAAPPTGGVDLGPVDELGPDELRPFVATVWSGVLVYRGQTSAALAFLHHALSTESLDGPLRWHARDQYAMRWGALGNYEESLWLVLQDEAAGRGADDRAARLNAMGTRVRLYDFVGLTDRAVETARAYLDQQREKKPGTEWLSAVGMLAELQAGAGRLDAAASQVDALEEACPDGCGGDLFSYLSSVWWAISKDQDSELGPRLMETMVRMGSEERDRQLAAARLYQGVQAMREKSYDQAVIGFLESARLYEKFGITVGVARARYFEMLAHIQREELQRAYDAGKEALSLRKELRDFEGVARVYNRLSTLYAKLDFTRRPEPYLRDARSVLTNSYKTQRARGSFGKAGESLYTLGTFLFKFGQHESARTLFRKAVGFSISSTRFDVAALSHLYLAMIARRKKDRNAFKKEIELAKTMAKLADSPEIEEAIERALNPKKKKKRDVPTQML